MWLKQILQKYGAVLGACALSVTLFGGSTNAQTPRYFDPELRIARPDLSGLPRLRFLTSLDFPPFNFADGNKKPTGLNVDLARAICDELNITAKCEIQAMPWGDLEAALNASRGEAIIAGTAITAEKRRQFNLSNTYFKFPARFIAKRGWTLSEGADFNDGLNGKKIAVIRGSAHEAMLKAYFSDVEITPLADAQLVYRAVASDEAELGLVDGVSASFWLTSQSAANCCAFVGEPFYADRYFGLGMAVVTRKADTELATAINSALKAIEESGKYAEIFQNYFPNSPHGSNF